MKNYEDIINNSPFILNHLISLKETHDYYLKQFLKKETGHQDCHRCEQA